MKWNREVAERYLAQLTAHKYAVRAIGIIAGHGDPEVSEEVLDAAEKLEEVCSVLRRKLEKR